MEHRRWARGFRYVLATDPIHDDRVLTRLKRLAAPLAWQNVRYSAATNAHLQCIGARGATTLNAHNLSCEDGVIALKFTGKSGKIVETQTEDTKLARWIEHFADVGSERLFRRPIEDRCSSCPRRACAP
ncbi:MAG: hypothetical protein AAGJ70_13435, partial [Pseudomonadota bacterium]